MVCISMANTCQPTHGQHIGWHAYVGVGVVTATGTAEFLLQRGDRHWGAMRCMFAYFVKADVVRALGLGHADAVARGLSLPGPSPKRRARRGRKRAKGGVYEVRPLEAK